MNLKATDGIALHGTPANDRDREFFERELSGFIPDRVFDVHAHLWPADGRAPHLPGGLPDCMDTQTFREWTDCLHPGRAVHALYLPLPVPSMAGDRGREQVNRANQWIADNKARDGNAHGLLLARPGDDPEYVRAAVKQQGLRGIKCYHYFSGHKPTWEAEIRDYLPDPLIEVADKEGWLIMLHLVRSRALLDPSNLDWIKRNCRRHANMKLILAHSARGFQPAHNLAALPALKGLANLYLETSANCEAIAHEAVIRILGHKRLMYGSDFPVSHYRGRSVGVADTFLWLYEDSPVWQEKHQRIEPVLVGLENLRALKWACWSAKLRDSAVEDIFFNNAARLLHG